MPIRGMLNLHKLLISFTLLRFSAGNKLPKYVLHANKLIQHEKIVLAIFFQRFFSVPLHTLPALHPL